MMLAIMSLAITSPSLLFDLIIAAYWKNAFSISDLHLHSEKKAGILLFLCGIHSFYLGSKMFSVYSEVRCAAASSPVRLFLGIELSHPAVLFFPERSVIHRAR